MSVNRRRLLAVTVGITWAGWAGIAWASRADAGNAPLQFADEAVRTAAMMVTVFVMLAFSIPPALAAMRVGRDIGRTEACDCHRRDGAIPLRRVRAGR